MRTIYNHSFLIVPLLLLSINHLNLSIHIHILRLFSSQTEAKSEGQKAPGGRGGGAIRLRIVDCGIKPAMSS